MRDNIPPGPISDDQAARFGAWMVKTVRKLWRTLLSWRSR